MLVAEAPSPIEWADTLQRPVQVTIQSDASLAGWGAVCNGVKTGGSWTSQEQEMHINCLELLATELAMKWFLKSHRGVTVLLQLDNSTAVAYINNLGGHSIPCPHHHGQITLAVGSGQRHNALSKTHSRSAEHYSRPGIQSGEGQVRLDALARSVQKSQPNSGPPGGRPVLLTVDSPIATVLQLETRPTGGSNRCISTGLGQLKGYANPPWCLVGRVLNKVRSQEAQLILVAQVWRGQSWYPILLGMLRDFLRLLSSQQAQMQRGGQQRTVEFTPQLTVWPVSGKI